MPVSGPSQPGNSENRRNQENILWSGVERSFWQELRGSDAHRGKSACKGIEPIDQSWSSTRTGPFTMTYRKILEPAADISAVMSHEPIRLA
ncbi:MAG: hypothetical protein D6690_17345 [Nitrospirae bacterium]|nr:MAG: hypothetical protein D6690_17345 [Nitrospirota bacterium]